MGERVNRNIDDAFKSYQVLCGWNLYSTKQCRKELAKLSVELKEAASYEDRYRILAKTYIVQGRHKNIMNPDKLRY